ncbi:MAG TPA: saccharopine dehydrogenase NADP-binding domain-containing protein, partial [Rhizobacter sp.]|nr:saccharopine dehydrogenase NADP-binding domain-containing protein [Rhizobacter sp.]
MKDILIIGGGKIGSVAAALLSQAQGDLCYRVTLADCSDAALADVRREMAHAPQVDTLVLDASDGAALHAALRGRFAVLSAAPFHLSVSVAQAARQAGVHYLDLTEDVASTRRMRELAQGAHSAFIPQCGLAPGFISIVAADLARQFDTLDSVRLR